MKTWEVFSWMIATTFSQRVTSAAISQACVEFLTLNAIRPRVGWLIDGSSATDYDPHAPEEIKAQLQVLAGHGLRYVAFVHPSSLIRTLVLAVTIPGITLKGFDTYRDAESWFRRRCPA